MRLTKTRILPVAALGVCVAAACHNPTGPDNPFADPNVLGTPILSVSAKLLAWLPGTSRVAYVTYPSEALGFLDLPVDTTSLRGDTACVASGGWGDGSLVFSHADTVAYYVECGYVAGPLRRVTLASGAHSTLRQGVGGNLRIDTSGTHLAYQTLDSIFVYDLVKGTDSLVARGALVTFSPDGTELLYRTIDTNAYYRVSLSTGAIVPVTAISQSNDAVAWTPIGIQYISEGRLYNVTTGKSMPINDNIALTWSSDGNLVAGWTNWCNSFACTDQRQVLTMANWSSGQVTVIARDSCAGTLGAVAYSPDNRTIVYSVCGQVYRTQIQ